MEAIKTMTGGKGVDIILDCVGPSFYELVNFSIRVIVQQEWMPVGSNMDLCRGPW